MSEQIYRAQENAKLARQAISEVKEFLGLFEKLNLPKPDDSGLLQAYERFVMAATEGVNIAAAADEVRRKMKITYIVFVKSLAGEYSDDEGARWVAEAEYARQWQKRATQMVLDINTDKSLIDRLANGWGKKLFDALMDQTKLNSLLEKFKTLESGLKRIADGDLPYSVDQLEDDLEGAFRRGFKQFLGKRYGVKRGPTDAELKQAKPQITCADRRRMYKNEGKFYEHYKNQFPQCFDNYDITPLSPAEIDKRSEARRKEREKRERERQGRYAPYPTD